MLTEDSDNEGNIVPLKDTKLESVSFSNIDVFLDRTACITLFVCDQNASVICQHIIKSFSMDKVAAVFTNEPFRECISEKFFSPEKQIFLINLTNPSQLSDSMLATWLTLVTEEKPKFSIILSSISRCALSVNHSERVVRKLATMTAKKLQPDFNLIRHVPDLEIGNIVSGVSASLINFFEARSLPAVLILSITESSSSGYMQLFHLHNNLEIFYLYFVCYVFYSVSDESLRGNMAAIVPVDGLGPEQTYPSGISGCNSERPFPNANRNSILLASC